MTFFIDVELKILKVFKVWANEHKFPSAQNILYTES